MSRPVSRLAMAQAAYDEACVAFRAARADRGAGAVVAALAFHARERTLRELEAAQAEYASKARGVSELMSAANAEDEL